MFSAIIGISFLSVPKNGGELAGYKKETGVDGDRLA